MNSILQDFLSNQTLLRRPFDEPSAFAKLDFRLLLVLGESVIRQVVRGTRIHGVPEKSICVTKWGIWVILRMNKGDMIPVGLLNKVSYSILAAPRALKMPREISE
jgi:hypothetical protein